MAVALDRRAVMAGAASLAAAPVFAQQSAPRVVVVGGGYGGATAARFLKRLAPTAEVTLVEASATYTSCPFSNLVIGGERELASQRFGYEGHRREGVVLVRDRARDVDAAAKTVTLAGGGALAYDRLILSPGVDFIWGGLEGYGEGAAAAMPHAWKAGVQTDLLRRQLDAMDDGGLVVMSAPASPYRCPPGPYERASLIAHFLKTRKPRSKLLILDAKDRFSKMPLFLAEWEERYRDVLEWRGAADDGRVARVDPGAMVLATDFEEIKADVANVIPPQRAGEIAQRAGVADATGWCPINATSFESTLQPAIHVIGDATIAAPMPKSAFSANLHGKVCAIQIARLLAGLEPEPTVLANTCYSYVAPDTAVSIAGVYSNADGAFANIPGAGGLSPAEPAPGERAREAVQAADWFRTITAQTFG
ncbi:MAG: NAD(P)/FAD-dependent oxidoreductase [Caulobacterales bacterium]|nr:NAD(P)/FAD-dependent oxidoreductase [Caulobacterales bacterium]